MTGIWAFDTESCDNKEIDGRMTARARSVEFFAAGFELKKIWRRANGTVKATATTSEEGEEGRGRGTIELKRVSPDRLSVKTDSGLAHIYQRCKQ